MKSTSLSMLLVALSMPYMAADSMLPSSVRQQDLQNLKHEPFLSGSVKLEQDVSDLSMVQPHRQTGEVVQLTCWKQGEVGSQKALRNSSCAYHGVHNGLSWAEALLNNSAQDAFLTSDAIQRGAEKKFGTTAAPWRQMVIQKRCESLVKRVISMQVCGMLSHTPSEVRDVLHALVTNNFVPSVVYRPQVIKGGLRYVMTAEEIYRELHEHIEKMLTEGASSAVKRVLHLMDEKEALLRLQSVLVRLLEATAIDITIDQKGCCRHTGDPKKCLDSTSEALDGSWVDTCEIDSLLRFAKKGYDPAIMVASYSENCGTGHEQIISDDLQAMLTKMENSNDDMVGVVLVYRGRQEMTQQRSWWDYFFEPCVNLKEEYAARRHAQNNDHWISVVVHRVHGVVTFYILDSLGTKKHHSHRAEEVILLFKSSQPHKASSSWSLAQKAFGVGSCVGLGVLWTLYKLCRS